MHVARQIFSEIAWAAFATGRRVKSRLLLLKRRLLAPKLPVNADGKIRIHLGCGDVASPGFINVDARPAPHVHHVCDVTDLSVFADNSGDLVYACHVLEHVSHMAMRRTLWEWRRVLKPGGVLRLSVPDFDKIIHIYESCSRSMDTILPPLMGGQTYKHDAHYCAFNRQYLSQRLVEAGFSEIREWDPEAVSNHDFTDWANTEFSVEGRSFPISLNLEAVK